MTYFLNRFPSEEWSGPAWYKPILKKGEKFPVGFELVHFHPVDLGHGTATTIEAGDTAKILTKTWKEYPETEKCMMGIIHSHHTMGAFFSGTDKSCIEDNAPQENFYCSTVVASAKERWAFACGYKDHYDKVHIYEASKGDVKMKMPPDEEESKWKYIADKIKKEKKETTAVGFYGRGNVYNQGTFWGHGDTQGFNGYGKAINETDPDEKLIEEIQELASQQGEPEDAFLMLLAEAYHNNKLQYTAFAEQLEALGLDPVSFIMAWNKGDTEFDKIEGARDVIALPETSEKSRLNSTRKA